MFRFYVYQNGRRLVSHPCDSYQTADRFLSVALDMPGVSGGDVEENIPGIGWCVCVPECDRELLEIC